MDTKSAIKVERFHQLDGEGPTKAFCDVLLLDTFIVKGLRVVEGKDGMFVSMPSEQGKDGKWYDTFYPVSSQVRKAVQESVLEQYKENR